MYAPVFIQFTLYQLVSKVQPGAPLPVGFILTITTIRAVLVTVSLSKDWIVVLDHRSESRYFAPGNDYLPELKQCKATLIRIVIKFVVSVILPVKNGHD